ncbi:MAG: hypothetical protein WCR08_12325 [Gammaproteobacteria bacterium]
MGIFGPKRKKITYFDPSDALIYLCGLGGQEQKTLGDIVLAFQGGGLLDTEKSVEIARRPPSQDQQLERKETAIAIIECFEASNLSNMGQGFAHGMFITSMTDMLSVDIKKVTPLQKAIAGGTINAMAQLVAAKNHELALTVGLCGQVLFVNSSAWLKERSKSR